MPGFLKLKSGGYLLLKTGGRLKLKGGPVAPEPAAAPAALFADPHAGALIAWSYLPPRPREEPPTVAPAEPERTVHAAAVLFAAQSRMSADPDVVPAWRVIQESLLKDARAMEKEFHAGGPVELIQLILDMRKMAGEIGPDTPITEITRH